jgi:DNA mismatch repair ATPase MutL
MDFFYNHSLLLPDVEYIPGQSVQLYQEKISVLNKIRRFQDTDIVAVHQQAFINDSRQEELHIEKPYLNSTTTIKAHSPKPIQPATAFPFPSLSLPLDLNPNKSSSSLPEHHQTAKPLWQNLVFPMPPKRITRLNLPTDSSIYLRFANDAIHERDVQYDSDLLRKAIVLNQIDCKFIACCHRDSEACTILLVDQHAADERIQLERLLRHYHKTDSNSGVPLDSPLQMHILHQEYEILKGHLDKLERWHFRLIFQQMSTDVMTASQLVSLWIESVPPIVKDDMSHYPTLPIRLIRNIIGLWMHGDIKNELPESLLELFKSKACRSKTIHTSFFLIHFILLLLT